MKRAFIWLRTLIFFITSFNCCKKSNILTAEETVKLVLKTRKSLIRLGDGEFNLLSGKGIHYQKYSESLRKDIDNIINTYINNGVFSKFVLCMPGEFIKCSGAELISKRVYVSSWAYTRYLFKYKYDLNINYGEAFLFAKVNENLYKQLWINSKVNTVIFVHNNIRYAQEFQKKYNITTHGVLIPQNDAYSVREEILNRIINLITDKEDTLVLISAGPCAKYLVYQLSLYDIWAIDTGHCWDYPLNLRIK